MNDQTEEDDFKLTRLARRSLLVTPLFSGKLSVRRWPLKGQKIWVRGTAITAPGDTNPCDATGVGYRTLKKLFSFSSEHLIMVTLVVSDKAVSAKAGLNA